MRRGHPRRPRRRLRHTGAGLRLGVAVRAGSYSRCLNTQKRTLSPRKSRTGAATPEDRGGSSKDAGQRCMRPSHPSRACVQGKQRQPLTCPHHHVPCGTAGHSRDADMTSVSLAERRARKTWCVCISQIHVCSGLCTQANGTRAASRKLELSLLVTTWMNQNTLSDIGLTQKGKRHVTSPGPESRKVAPGWGGHAWRGWVKATDSQLRSEGSPVQHVQHGDCSDNAISCPRDAERAALRPQHQTGDGTRCWVS